MELILRVRSMMLFNRPASTFTNPASAVSKNAGGNTCAITCDMCSCSVISAASQEDTLNRICLRRLRQLEVEALSVHRRLATPDNPHTSRAHCHPEETCRMIRAPGRSGAAPERRHHTPQA